MKSKVKYIFIIAIFFIVVWHAVWGINYQSYFKYSDGYEKHNISMVKTFGDYTYTLKCPSYPSFIGNFAITNEKLAIIIWPGLFTNGEYTFGLEIYDEENHAYRFYVDQDFNYIDEQAYPFSDEEIGIIHELLDKYRNELYKMNQHAEIEWD